MDTIRTFVTQVSDFSEDDVDRAARRWPLLLAAVLAIVLAVSFAGWHAQHGDIALALQLVVFAIPLGVLTRQLLPN